ncbi:MAG: hypothetical protein A2Z15_07015 [Chloroflexi bacterium RBG_16_50_11]|nr:MAG: hypothetical protein A2Z15_07015 [Chloroflexi bacterium RBG_16_50_11]
MKKFKYEKCIIEGVRPDLKLADFRINTNDFVPGMETRLLHLDEKTLKGSFYVSCFWFWKGSEEVLVKPHVHEYDEVLGCIGTDPKDPQDLCGEIEFWLDDEKYLIRKSSLIFVPKGLKHAPFIVRTVNRPIFHFTTGPTGMYI